MATTFDPVDALKGVQDRKALGRAVKAMAAEERKKRAAVKSATAANIAKIATAPKGKQRTQLLKLIRERQAESDRIKHEARKARIKAAQARKVTTMTTELAAERPAAAKTESPAWTPDAALAAIKLVHGGGYKAITIAPHRLVKKFEKGAGKTPAVLDAGVWQRQSDWPDNAMTATLAHLTAWHGHTNSAPNVGILCGTLTERGHLIAVDVDVDAPELVADIAELCGGDTFIRIGRDGRSGLIPLIVDDLGDVEGFKREHAKKAEVQLLRSRKQFVAQGIHPDTLRPYRWTDFTFGDEVDMPSVDRLSVVRMAELVKALEDNGFEACGVGGSAVTGNEQKAKLRLRLKARKLDADAFEDHFGDDGAFSISALAETNPAFAKLYQAHEDENAEPEGRHHPRRMALAKDFYRAHGDKFGIEHANLLFDKWPGAGEHLDRRAGKGTFTDAHVVNAYAQAVAEVKAEQRGEIKQHPSTRTVGEAFGAIDDEDEGNAANGEGGEAIKAKSDSGAEGKAQSPRYISLTDLIAEPATFTRWVVKHFIACNTTYIAAGLWGSGKTAVLLDIALHVAHGLPWRGRKVQKGVVVYCALENPGDVKSRVRAWCKRNGEGLHLEDSFVMYQANATLFDPNNKGTPDERKIIKLANETAEKLGLPVAMVIIDTVAQAIMPGNDREHGGLFVAAMQRIAAATGANVTGLHHPSKDGDAVRGDGRFQGNTDAILLVERDLKTGLGTIKASEQKFRIGDPHKAVFNYRLEPVKMDVDEDHEDINVVVATEARDETWVVEDPETDARLSEAVRMADFDEYPDYLADFMRRRIAGSADGVNGKMFLSDDLRADTAGALDHFANRKPGSDPAKLLNQRRAQLSRALSALEKRELVRIELIAGRHTVVHMLS